jgi:hypothetical protein
MMTRRNSARRAEVFALRLSEHIVFAGPLDGVRIVEVMVTGTQVTTRRYAIEAENQARVMGYAITWCERSQNRRIGKAHPTSGEPAAATRRRRRTRRSA